jgi:hypothetical protein
MSKTRKAAEPGSLFPGLIPLEPPPELRPRVIGKCMEALAAGPEPDRWTVLWESRLFRLAWGACLLALLAAHVLITPGRADRERAVQKAAPDLIHDQGGELAGIVPLPRVRSELLPLGGEHRSDPAVPAAGQRKERKS